MDFDQFARAREAAEDHAGFDDGACGLHAFACRGSAPWREQVGYAVGDAAGEVFAAQAPERVALIG
ncbi:MAG: hypothetical protein IPG56_01315 [Caulobacteraceae bacterium]|nr:hypothetical protein [Caulobacteraceae bacterium]